MRLQNFRILISVIFLMYNVSFYEEDLKDHEL